VTALSDGETLVIVMGLRDLSRRVSRMGGAKKLQFLQSINWGRLLLFRANLDVFCLGTMVL
jgi:hypothetical protein